MTKVLTIASGKGGAGKTTIAINLGSALTALGREVIVLDANIYSPHVGLSLGLNNPKTGFHHVLAGKKRLNEVIHLHHSGLKVIPSTAMDSAQMSLPALKAAMEGLAEAIIIDSPSGTSRFALDAIGIADNVLLVTQPDMPSVADAIRIAYYMRSRKISALGVVMNQVRQEQGELTQRSIQALLEQPVLSTIPDDRAVREALRRKEPVVTSYPTSPAALAFTKLARDLI